VLAAVVLVKSTGAQVRLTITVNAAYSSVVNRIAQFMSDMDAELAAAAGLPQAAVRTTAVTAGVCKHCVPKEAASTQQCPVYLF
jgi:hypothetical protein